MGALGWATVTGVALLAAGLAVLGVWWLVESRRTGHHGAPVPGDPQPVVQDERPGPPPLVINVAPPGRHRA